MYQSFWCVLVDGGLYQVGLKSWEQSEETNYLGAISMPVAVKVFLPHAQMQ